MYYRVINRENRPAHMQPCQGLLEPRLVRVPRLSKPKKGQVLQGSWKLGTYGERFGSKPKQNLWSQIDEIEKQTRAVPKLLVARKNSPLLYMYVNRVHILKEQLAHLTVGSPKHDKII